MKLQKYPSAKLEKESAPYEENFDSSTGGDDAPGGMSRGKLSEYFQGYSRGRLAKKMKDMTTLAHERGVSRKMTHAIKGFCCSLGHYSYIG